MFSCHPMSPRVRVPPEEDEAPPPPQPATTSNATTSADINASNLLLTLINLPSSANNSRLTQLLTSVRHCRIRFLRFRHLVATHTSMSIHGALPFRAVLIMPLPRVRPCRKPYDAKRSSDLPPHPASP